MLAAILPTSNRITEPLRHFLTTVDAVEHRSGLDLFATREDYEEETLEAQCPLK